MLHLQSTKREAQRSSRSSPSVPRRRTIRWHRRRLWPQAVAQLQAAGARYLIVPDSGFFVSTGWWSTGVAQRADKLLYTQTLWSAWRGGRQFHPSRFQQRAPGNRGEPVRIWFSIRRYRGRSHGLHATCRDNERLGAAVLFQSRCAFYAGGTQRRPDAAVCRRPTSLDGRAEDPGRLLLWPCRCPEPDLVSG